MRLRDRIALVTGAAGGIGAATARRVAREGAAVASNDAWPDGLAAVGGDGQRRLLGSTVLLHGDAPLAARYLAAGGLGRLLVTGDAPALAARDPAFRIGRAAVDAPADVVLDLGPGREDRHPGEHAGRGRAGSALRPRRSTSPGCRRVGGRTGSISRS